MFMLSFKILHHTNLYNYNIYTMTCVYCKILFSRGGCSCDFHFSCYHDLDVTLICHFLIVSSCHNEKCFLLSSLLIHFWVICVMLLKIQYWHYKHCVLDQDWQFIFCKWCSNISKNEMMALAEMWQLWRTTDTNALFKIHHWSKYEYAMIKN